MATKKGLTVESVTKYIKEKWQVFGVATLFVFVLQFLSTKILVALVLGLVLAALLPSDSVKTVGKKLQLVKEDE